MKSAGRPKKKPDYNPEEIATTLMETLTESYRNPGPGEEAPDDPKHRQLKLLAEEFSMTRLKVRKLLITAGSYETPISREVNRLHQQGKSIAEIQEATGLKRASVHSYLPYSKAIYNLEDATVTAERIRKYRSRKQSVELLKKIIATGNHSAAEAALWDTLILFQNYAFNTAEGLRFYHQINREFGIGKSHGITEKRNQDNRSREAGMFWSRLFVSNLYQSGSDSLQ